MPRFENDPNRLNHTIEQSGKEYNLRLLQRAQAIFTTFLNLLPSNYISAIEGPNYTLEIKAMAVELARIELALEDVSYDRDYTLTRSDFLYSMIGYMVFLNGRLPPEQFDDQEFRNFLINLIRIFFQGSTPKSMQDAVDLFITSGATVKENFLLLRQGASGLDISDQYGFQVDVVLPPGGGFPPNIFDLDSTLRIIFDIIRPAHTLFRIRYIFSDKYNPNNPLGKILDASRWRMSNYYYEDLRSYWSGLRDRDRLGKKTNQFINGEDHSADF